MRRLVGLFVVLPLLTSCVSASAKFERLPVATADECAVVAAYLNDPANLPARSPSSIVRSEVISVARPMFIQFESAWKPQPSAETFADARSKTRSARLDLCEGLATSLAAIRWSLRPTSKGLTHVRAAWIIRVSRVGLNAAGTEGIVSVSLESLDRDGGPIGSDVSEGGDLLFRKDPQTGAWRKVGGGVWVVE